ncbi:Hypothetical predicted protein, partial [Pelobates cultripes]
ILPGRTWDGFFQVSSLTGSLTLCLVRCFLRSQFPRKSRFRSYPPIRLLPVSIPLLPDQNQGALAHASRKNGVRCSKR